MHNSLIISKLSELPEAAVKLIELFQGKKVIAFNGVMGAGKTTLIKAICQSLGVVDTISSPTFSLVNEYHYDNKSKIYHFDFYRIKSLSEAYDMGYEEYFFSGSYCFIEWPEKIAELLPKDCIHINISQTGEKRIIELV